MALLMLQFNYMVIVLVYQVIDSCMIMGTGGKVAIIGLAQLTVMDFPVT